MTAAVLVLNSTYVPISRTKVSRAITLVLEGLAVIEESDPLRRLRHKHGEFPYPTVLRLLKFVKVPFKYGEVTWTKAGVMRRDHHICGYCGKNATTVDHILPRAQGGQNTWLNTVASCERCNFKKRDRRPEECGMVLRTKPHVPKRQGFLSVR